MSAPPKILWRCRRGMREMDILCTRFVEETYDQLSDGERDVLERLLDCPDPDILAWLSGGVEPADVELASMISRMRATTGYRRDC